MIQDDGRKIQCTQQLSGTSRLEWLTDFDGKKIFSHPASMIVQKKITLRGIAKTCSVPNFRLEK
ncbi:MAG: hypothetical protein OXC17_03420 [Aestuariivita sp.]|nr:hypothetical protein [Aestuariivita sp.]